MDDSEYETDGCSDEDAENEYESESENDADESDDITGPGNSKQQHRSSHQNNDEGVADIFIQPDKNIALVRQFDDYRYRGDSFSGFNAYEYLDDDRFDQVVLSSIRLTEIENLVTKFWQTGDATNNEENQVSTDDELDDYTH